jgi:hypothetical protein
VQVREPEPVNILTAMAENEDAMRSQNDMERKAIALAWLFHLVGDIQYQLRKSRLQVVSMQVSSPAIGTVMAQEAG